MNLLDNLDLYAMQNGSDDLFLMLQQYTLDSRIDRDVLNRVIIKELGDMRPVTNNPMMLKFMIEEFFSKWNYNISKLLDTMYLEYNPLHNKDVFKTEDETTKRDEDTAYTGHENNDVSNENTSKLDTSAYDVDTYQPRNMTSGNSHTDNINNSNGTGTLDRQDDRDLTVHESGKDNDTSYQTLVEQERRVAQFNIFNWIIKQMRKELFILVY